MRSLHYGIDTVRALEPKQVTNTESGQIIDVSGCESVEFVLMIGAIANADANNICTPSLEEGDAANLAGAVAVTAANQYGAFVPINNVLQANTVQKVGWRNNNNRRYVRLVLTEGGAGGGFDAQMSCLAIKGNLRHQPQGIAQVP
jgi:hypothetical protein